MYKNISLLLIFLSSTLCCQQLPKIDYGFILSYNNSNRNIPLAPKQHAINFATLDYRFHFNFKNKISIKTAVSVFFTGHTFSYLFVPDRGFGKSWIKSGQSIYGYFRIPFILSYNIKRFYVDLGLAGCVRFINNSNSYYQRGNGIKKPAGTYTLEGKIGYYIPLKYRRLFVEGGVCFSEINGNIFLPGGYFKNNYSRNLQLSIGYMFNRIQ